MHFCRVNHHFLPPILARQTLLDTLDHFDYDSACTMILNLELTMSVAAIKGVRRGLIWTAEG